MKWTGLNELRESYLHFFESKGHLRQQSAPLVPQGDKSLLLINSGMAPLKPYFTGQIAPPSRRMTTCQKCIRTPDIERVGKTARHGTFFEMLGNFSFGDYFKREATAWAWEFCTKVLELPVELLYVSIYENDDEAFDIWTKEVGVDPSHMVRLGTEDNFWEIGTGPCGPCSEIYFDRGPDWGCGKETCAVGCDCDRYIEFWNLVFTQFDSDGAGNYTPLAKPNIDTGMGLERIACIMQGVGNLFEVDTIVAITDHISGIVGVKYRDNPGSDVSLRVISDHIRSTTMMISDGVTPSNEGRGYVLRRLLRRAARHGKLLGYDQPFLYQVVDTVVDNSGKAYPNLVEKRDLIKRIVKVEEERFSETIDAGLDILHTLIRVQGERGTLPGEEAFKLYDTFGFPIDLTREILEEYGMQVDDQGFDALMQQQRERARAARMARTDLGWSENAMDALGSGVTTVFEGYDLDHCDARVLALANAAGLCDSISPGDEGCVVLTDTTVFYPEGGGQVGDTGRVEGDGFSADVLDTRKLPDGKILHVVEVTDGTISTGDTVQLRIDRVRRMHITRNHTATHLLGMALRRALGTHVSQAGSLVEPSRLRFDFSHFEGLTPEQIAQVEQTVNEAILAAVPVSINTMSMAMATEKGAIADFGEKYGEIVRVIDIAGYTVDLCGGCHLSNTAQAGLFKIVSEGSVAAGVRRIEAVTGHGLLELLQARDELIQTVSHMLKTKPADLQARVRSFVEEHRQLAQTGESVRSRLINLMQQDVLMRAETMGSLRVVIAHLPELSADDLKIMADRIKLAGGSLFLLLVGGEGEKLSLFAAATKQAVDSGVHAGNILKQVAATLGGNGGGKPDSAQGGGRAAERLPEALKLARTMVAEAAGQ